MAFAVSGVPSLAWSAVAATVAPLVAMGGCGRTKRCNRVERRGTFDEDEMNEKGCMWCVVCVKRQLGALEYPRRNVQ